MAGSQSMCALILAGNQFRVNADYFPKTAGMGSSKPHEDKQFG